LIPVVEDNAAERATVILLLKTLQYRILEADNGD
jgi:CheY-like chemotaxis protein